MQWVIPSAWTDKISYQQDSHPWLWVGPWQHLPHPWSDRVCQRTGLEVYPQDFHDSGQQQDILAEFQWGSSIDSIPKTRDLEPDQQLIAIKLHDRLLLPGLRRGMNRWWGVRKEGGTKWGFFGFIFVLLIWWWEATRWKDRYGRTGRWVELGAWCEIPKEPIKKYV